MIIFKTILKLKGYNIDRASNELNNIQSYSLDDFKIWQEKKKWELVKFHYSNNRIYKKKIGNNLPTKWENLPILEKADYQMDMEELLSEGYSKSNTYIGNTSGSSGQPFFFAKNKYAHAMSWALINNRYSWYDIKLHSRQARFFGIPLENTSKFQEKIKDWIMNRTRFPIFDMSSIALENFIIKFKKNKFKYIYGYVNSLVLFARYLLEKKIILNTICPSLNYCITTSEVLTKEDRNILSKSFGVPIINEYGVSEAGALVAFENTKNHWLLNRETQFIEIVDQYGRIVKDGSSGDILITDLYNKAMPFIRYRVGDIGIIKKGRLSNNYQVLDKLIGRTNDNILLPSGKISPGLTFYYISRSILESSGILKEFIIRQISINTFIFDVVSERDLNGNEKDDIKKKMDQYLEKGLTLKINRVKKINRPPSGKLKHFYSEISS